LPSYVTTVQQHEALMQKIRILRDSSTNIFDIKDIIMSEGRHSAIQGYILQYHDGFLPMTETLQCRVCLKDLSICYLNNHVRL
jgi:hypothetical protein